MNQIKQTNPKPDQSTDIPEAPPFSVPVALPLGYENQN
jgi:hypothetical protein